MLEVFIFTVAVSTVFVVLILIWGKAKKREGKLTSDNEDYRDKMDRISRGVEKLMGPRPSRAVLIEHWERRLRKATGRGSDTSLPDPKRKDN